MALTTYQLLKLKKVKLHLYSHSGPLWSVIGQMFYLLLTGQEKYEILTTAALIWQTVFF